MIPTAIHDVVIVGAGLAGLTAARTLTAAGLDVLVVEKNHTVGGRLATDSLGEGRADSGAQFFTVRSAEFAAEVDRSLAAGLVYEWSRGWSDGSADTTRPSDKVQPVAHDGFPRYAVRGGFNQLAQHLSIGLNIRLRTAIRAIASADGHWVLSTESGSLSANRLLLTPPVPLSLALLDAGAVALPPGDRAALEQIAYAPCLCGLLAIDGETDLPEPGALQRPDAALSWLADNWRKGISPGARVLTAHVGPEASVDLWNQTDDDILNWIEDEVLPFLRPTTTITARQLRRWPYALPTRLHPEPVLRAGTDRPLVFAGDAFGTARVEGAFLSGLAAGRT